MSSPADRPATTEADTQPLGPQRAEADEPPPPLPAPLSGDDPALEAIARYRLGPEIAVGGIGVVYHARDLVLKRDLAVKVLKPEHRDNPDLIRRFLEEAQVGGQLQHPGVVAVHGLGRLPDGRPFFAMRLVNGRTLEALLAERPEPAADLPRFLKIFEQVCQTLAYAHSKRIIHRDLKPLNIMVGAFGEVQVMDWGLAKRVAPSHQPEAQARDSPPSRALQAGERNTEAGVVMGTFLYMAPEQARGETDCIDERADVFGLGALLCELLTGQPPYERREQAERADLESAWTRLASCGADAALVRLARECLAAERTERPRDAGAVTEAATAYLAGVQDRLRQMELDRAWVQAEGLAQAERKLARRMRTPYVKPPKKRRG
jgi:serine/threonine-protein kinase